MNLITSTNLTMTSLEIAGMLDARHDKVKQSIERLAERGVIVQPPLGGEPGTDTMGRPRTTQVFVFSGEQGKRDSIIVVAQMSPEVTARLVDRWQELEAQVALPQQPTAPLLPSTQAKTLISDMLEVAALFKVPEHIAQTEAVKSARLTYNVDFSPLLLSAPAQNEIRPEDEMLEPTELGKRLGMGAVKMNQALADLGLQKRVNGAWEPTDTASGLCARHQWVKGGKSGYNYKWKVAAVEARLNMLEAA